MSNENNWGASESAQGPSKQQNHSTGGATDSLLELLGTASLLGSQRNVPEVEETAKLIREHVDALKKGTPSEVHKRILPEVNIITKPIVSALPGMILSLHLSNVVFVMPVLFSNRNLNMTLEEIHLDRGQQNQKVSIPFTPTSYVRKELVTQISEQFKANYASKGVNEAIVINLKVCDLEQYVSEEVLNAGRSMVLRDEIMRAWEQGIIVAVAKQSADLGRSLPVPFVGENKDKPYGVHNNAIARVEPIQGQVTQDGIPTGSNLVVRLQTANQNGYNQATDTSREIVSAFATVSLMGNPIRQFQAQNTGPVGYFQSSNGRPNGYFPLQPMVTMNYAKPGEVMGDNTGLATFFMGLFGTVATNNNYLFSEGLRSKTVGARGSLVDMEARIDAMESGVGLPVRDKNTRMTDAKLADIDFTNNWIRTNISPKATFACDIAEFGRDAAIFNFLLGLVRGAAEFTRNVKATIAILDSMTKKQFSRIVSENAKKTATLPPEQRSWTPDQPILIPSSMLVPVGSVRYEGRTVCLSEFDEMMLSHLYQQDSMQVGNILTNLYGDGGQTPDKVRRYNLTTTLTAIFGDVHITGFGRRFFYNPKFMDVFTEAMNTLGNLQVSGTLGTFTSVAQVYAPGLSLVTQATAGQTGAVINSNGGVVGNGSSIIFGVQ